MAATKAFLLIETQVGKTKDVVDGLVRIKGVASVDMVTGPYDIIATIEAGNLASVGELVTSSLQVKGPNARTLTSLTVGDTK